MPLTWPGAHAIPAPGECSSSLRSFARLVGRAFQLQLRHPTLRLTKNEISSVASFNSLSSTIKAFPDTPY